MLNWVSMGFLISLDLWYNLIFVCRIQCYIPFCSARQKFFFFFRIQWLISFYSFLILCGIEQVKPFCSFVFVQYQVIYSKLLCWTKDFVFLQNQVIYTNLLIWTKAFLFLEDPVIYTIQLCEIKAFLFLQDPVTSTILLYQTKLFFHGRFHLCIAFFFPFCV